MPKVKKKTINRQCFLSALYESGIKQYMVAEELGVQPTYLSACVNGKRNISEKLLDELAQVLDCSPDYLTGPFNIRDDIPTYGDYIRERIYKEEIEYRDVTYTTLFGICRHDPTLYLSLSDKQKDALDVIVNYHISNFLRIVSGNSVSNNNPLLDQISNKYLLDKLEHLEESNPRNDDFYDMVREILIEPMTSSDPFDPLIEDVSAGAPPKKGRKQNGRKQE